VLRRLGKIGAALAERCLLAERFAYFLDLAGDGFPLLLVGAKKLFDTRLLLAQRLVLVLDLHFLELAQIAQSHIEDGVGLDLGELEGFHQDGLGLVLVADDLDDLVEIQVGDDSRRDFEPCRSGRRISNGAAARRGGASHSRNTSARLTPWDAAPPDVHVERDAAFSSVA
jgi:hypothetical protein